MDETIAMNVLKLTIPYNKEQLKRARDTSLLDKPYKTNIINDSYRLLKDIYDTDHGKTLRKRLSQTRNSARKGLSSLFTRTRRLSIIEENGQSNPLNESRSSSRSASINRGSRGSRTSRAYAKSASKALLNHKTDIEKESPAFIHLGHGNDLTLDGKIHKINIPSKSTFSTINVTNIPNNSLYSDVLPDIAKNHPDFFYKPLTHKKEFDKALIHFISIVKENTIPGDPYRFLREWKISLHTHTFIMTNHHNDYISYFKEGDKNVIYKSGIYEVSQINDKYKTIDFLKPFILNNNKELTITENQINLIYYGSIFPTSESIIEEIKKNPLYGSIKTVPIRIPYDMFEKAVESCVGTTTSLDTMALYRGNHFDFSCRNIDVDESLTRQNQYNSNLEYGNENVPNRLGSSKIGTPRGKQEFRHYFVQKCRNVYNNDEIKKEQKGSKYNLCIDLVNSNIMTFYRLKYSGDVSSDTYKEALHTLTTIINFIDEGIKQKKYDIYDIGDKLFNIIYN
uniref:Uncharacterized protein n=1 Tax=viral metagenome TaxID=1070528 RepID=A0A6C0ETC7_9ZZZZ